MQFTELETFMLNSAEKRDISGYCIIIHKDGKEVYKKSYAAHRGDDTAYGNSRHWVFSMTKPVTALMGVILLEKGIISLDDELSRFFPEYSQMFIKEGNTLHKSKQPILLRHLFNMTAGLNYDIFCPTIKNLDRNATTQEVIRELAKEPLDFEPGTAFEYSLCFDVLAAVYEKATGEKISGLYKKYIFDKLDMKNTSFVPDGNISPVFYLTDKNEVQNFGNKNIYVFTDNYESGGAGLISTAEDYIKFADLLSNKGRLKSGEPLISERSSELFYKHYLDNKTLNRFAPFCKEGYSYGFGCRTLVSNDCGALSPCGEFGWDGAAGSYVLMDAKNNISVVYIQDLLFENDIYDVIHPKIRDLTYKGFFNCKEEAV